MDRLWKTTDAENNTVETQYYADGAVHKVIDAMSKTAAEYTCDGNGNVTMVKDAKGNETTYTYDAFGRLDQTTFEDLTYEEFAYDTAGRMYRKTTRAGETITFTFDQLNRTETKTVQGSETVYYRYDLISRLKELESSVTGQNSYDYDNAGRLLTTTYPDSKSVSYEYDAVNLIKLTYPDSMYVTYVYDDLNRLEQIKDSSENIITKYILDGLSRREQTQYWNNSQTITYGYDNRSRLTSVDNKIGTTPIGDFDYTHDNVGNRLTMTVGGTDVHTYAYDDNYRLTAVDYPHAFPRPDTTFAYDDVGNRTSVSDTQTTAYVPNALNQYGTVGGATYQYDNNGNLTVDPAGGTYTYNAENRMTTATVDGVSTAYMYDPLGRRIAKTVDNAETTYVYSGDQVLCEYDGAGRMARRYVYGAGIDEPVRMTVYSTSADVAGGGSVGIDDLRAMASTWLLESEDTGFDSSADLNRDSRVDNIDAEILSAAWDSAGGDATADYYYQYDGQGNVIALTDSSGNVVEEYEYDVYGRVVISGSNGHIRTGSSVGNPYMFTGRRLDRETGLYYYRARYYSPRLGRFLQTDPIGYADGINWYAYCSNNPLAWVDPYGLCERRQLVRQKKWDDVKNAVARGFATSVDLRYRGLHLGMDVAGAVPGIGEPVDFIHGVALAGESIAGVREGAALESGLTFAAMLPIIGDIGGKGGKYAFKYGDEGLAYADEAYILLTKSLASADEMSQAGKIIASGDKFRDAAGYARRYGGEASDWVKKTSTAHKTADGMTMQTHWVENISTGERLNHKTKISWKGPQ